MKEKRSICLKLLNDRLIIKDYISMFKKVPQVPTARQLMNLEYNVHKSYDAFIKEQKSLKKVEERKKQKKVMREEIENKKQSVEKLEKKIKQTTTTTKKSLMINY